MPEDVRYNKRQRQERRAEAMGKYKEISEKLKTINQLGDSQALQNFISDNLNILSELYPIVKRKLEGASADSRILKQLLAICLESANRINRTSRIFDTKRTIRELMRDMEEENGKKARRLDFFRHIVDNHVKTFMCNAPTLEFIYGTLRSEGLEPKVKRRRLREKITESAPSTAKQRNIELEVDEDSTPKEVEYICEKLVALTERKPRGISFFESLIDPKSFSQTVENIFHVSFLVKEGKIGVKKDDVDQAILYVGSPAVNGSNSSSISNTARERERNLRRDDHNNHQSILSFSMNDYTTWISRFNIKKRAFPVRE